MKVIDEIIIIDKMLTDLGYGTELITIDEILDIRKAIKEAIKTTKNIII